MIEQQVTQYELAQRMNVQAARIYRLKKGQIKSPRFKFICQIADALLVPTDTFKIEPVTNQGKEQWHVEKDRSHHE